MVSFVVPQRSDPEELTFDAEAVDRDRRVEEAVEVERTDVLGRCVRPGEREMALQQGADILPPRVVDPDLAFGHGTNLGNPQLKRPCATANLRYNGITFQFRLFLALGLRA
jgi:hypothetical protein